MTLRRLPDWQVRLEAFARERLQRPFAWGSNDCCTFAADAVQALTGEALHAEMRGLDVRGSLRALRAAGGVRQLASQVLGEEIPPLMASVGDIVVVPAGKREALAVCNGTVAMAPGPDGLTFVAMQQWRAAWRVG